MSLGSKVHTDFLSRYIKYINLFAILWTFYLANAYYEITFYTEATIKSMEADVDSENIFNFDTVKIALFILAFSVAI
jgi:hypothetical protein